MATRSIIESDLSGKTGAATVTFGLGGTWYEVDLTKEELADLEKSLAAYQKVGRKVPEKERGNAKNPNRFVPETTREERERIKAWALENGYDFAAKGKIPNKIYFAYRDAHHSE